MKKTTVVVMVLIALFSCSNKSTGPENHFTVNGFAGDVDYGKPVINAQVILKHYVSGQVSGGGIPYTVELDTTYTDSAGYFRFSYESDEDVIIYEDHYVQIGYPGEFDTCADENTLDPDNSCLPLAGASGTGYSDTAIYLGSEENKLGFIALQRAGFLKIYFETDSVLTGFDSLRFIDTDTVLFTKDKLPAVYYTEPSGDAYQAFSWSMTRNGAAWEEHTDSIFITSFVCSSYAVQY